MERCEQGGCAQSQLRSMNSRFRSTCKRYSALEDTAPAAGSIDDPALLEVLRSIPDAGAAVAAVATMESQSPPWDIFEATACPLEDADQAVVAGAFAEIAAAATTNGRTVRALSEEIQRLHDACAGL